MSLPIADGINGFVVIAPQGVRAIGGKVHGPGTPVSSILCAEAHLSAWAKRGWIGPAETSASRRVRPVTSMAELPGGQIKANDSALTPSSTRKLNKQQTANKYAFQDSVDAVRI